MSLYEKMQNTTQDLDTAAFMALIHEDFVMVSHQDGTTNNKAELGEIVNYMFASDDFAEREHRCLFENEEAMVTHSFMDFPDGTTEASVVPSGKSIKLWVTIASSFSKRQRCSLSAKSSLANI